MEDFLLTNGLWYYQQDCLCGLRCVFCCVSTRNPVSSPNSPHKTIESIHSKLLMLNNPGNACPESALILSSYLNSNFSYKLLDTRVCVVTKLQPAAKLSSSSTFIQGPTPCWESLISRLLRGRNMSSSRQTATGDLPVNY